MDLDLTVSFKVADKKFDGNIRDFIKIDENKLSDEFANQPSLYAWFSALSEMASSEVSSLEFHLDLIKANNNKKIREQLNSSGTKVTEALVESMILMTPEFVEANRFLLEKTRQASILKSVVKALEQRKDMLIQLGGMRRQEMAIGDFNISLPKIKQNNCN